MSSKEPRDEEAEALRPTTSKAALITATLCGAAIGVIIAWTTWDLGSADRAPPPRPEVPETLSDARPDVPGDDAGPSPWLQDEPPPEPPPVEPAPSSPGADELNGSDEASEPAGANAQPIDQPPSTVNSEPLR